MHRKGVVFLSLLVIFPLACGREERGTQEDATAVALRLKWTLTAHTAAGPGIAQKRGFFAREGLDVDLRPGGFEFDPITLVAAGSEDFGVKGADDILLARAKGVPVVAIAMDYQLNPVNFMWLEDSEIETPRDFEGRSVGVKHGQNVFTFYKVMLRRLSIDRSLIREIPVRQDVSPLLTGEVDVYPGYDTFEPAIFAARGIGIRSVLARDYGVPSYGNVLFTSERTIATRRDLVKRFVRAYVEGWRWATENAEQAARIMADLNPDFSYELQRDMLKRTIRYIRPTQDFEVGTMTRQGWIETQRVLIEEGLLEGPQDIDSAYTMEFLTTESRRGE